jgi:hypothetical protein
MIKATLVAIGLATAGLATLAAPFAMEAVAQQSGQSVSGTWKGGWVSASGEDVNTFDVSLTQRGTRLVGTLTEVNTIGDSATALFLTSTLTGEINGSSVRFVKTYDGSGGVSHSVSYVGTLEAGGRRIRGTFNVSGNNGVFEMVR